MDAEASDYLQINSMHFSALNHNQVVDVHMQPSHMPYTHTIYGEKNGKNELHPL